eukprot:7108265-Prymnesium_polylepis.1
MPPSASSLPRRRHTSPHTSARIGREQRRGPHCHGPNGGCELQRTACATGPLPRGLEPKT